MRHFLHTISIEQLLEVEFRFSDDSWCLGSYAYKELTEKPDEDRENKIQSSS